MELAVSQLVEYAIRKEWITEQDRIWASNRLLEVLEVKDFAGLVEVDELPPISDILRTLCDFAYEQGIIEGNSAAYYDIFDTKLVGMLLPAPSRIIESFSALYNNDPKQATDWYYELSGDTNYIRRDRIAKDRKWVTKTEYGDLDITINLSKPEKDPKAIAAAGRMKSSSYPKCLLCAENEGYAGHLNHPARQNHRIIPIKLSGRDFFLQYSPYVYYNEHSIIFNSQHTPMHIDREAIDNLLDFVTQFPHYFIGSNADLPIVGGSVLSHDHYQGGNYEFPMARAEIEKEFAIPEYEDVKAGIVKWPMSVIRLQCEDRTRLAQAAEHVLLCWREYDDEEAFIFHETDGEKHSTITPIVRRRGSSYEIDLVLRNNIVTDEHPLGVYHPHSDKHHIKKENIGLIEVMGLAVLPARLLGELDKIKEVILSGGDVAAEASIASHKEWIDEVVARRGKLDSNNIDTILEEEVGKVFSEVLEDAGVFKRDEKGMESFQRFLDIL